MRTSDGCDVGRDDTGGVYVAMSLVGWVAGWVVGPADRPFHAFTPAHYLILGIFAVGCAGVVAFGRRHRGKVAEVRIRRGFAALVLVVMVPITLADFLPGQFTRGASFPFQLCDLAWMSAAYALWTLRPWAIALTYYWGLVLSVQGIITPSLGQSFPDPRFFGFWTRHFLIVWAAVYLTWGLRRVPDWHGYRVTVAATAVWAVLVAAFNTAAGTNYGYLNHKPGSASILNVMGSWPWYIGTEIGVLLLVWALMTWPWVHAAGAPTATRPGNGGRSR